MATRTSSEVDAGFMRRALELARNRLGRTSPNPAVGCIIVRDGRVIGSAATAPGGRPHAEPQALARAGVRARGATAYVTFEPCAHFGQTPPCCEALIAAGIRRVVIGCIDPFRRVRGRGAAKLRVAGVDVVLGVLKNECRQLNEGFITRVTKGRPFGLLKLALSADGRIATTAGKSRWISGPEARNLVHRWRAECDAVMVGAGTVIADNPRLTCRISGGRDPARIVIDAHLRSPPQARVFRQSSKSPAILITTRENRARAEHRYGVTRAEIIGVSAKAGNVSIGAAMHELGNRGFSKVLIEGGARLAGSALNERTVDRIAFFLTPRIFGGGLAAVEGLRFATVRRSIRLKDLNARRIGGDWLLEAEL